MKKILSLLLLLNFACFSQPSKKINKIQTQNNNAPAPVGTLSLEDWDSRNWTYSGSGSAVFNSNNIVMSGGTSAITSFLKYTYLPTVLNTATTTIRVTMTNTGASDGVVGLGLISRNSATLRHFCILNCRTANKGNLLMYYENAFDSETNPTVIPFTEGDQIEIQMIQTLLSLNFRARNVTQASSYTSLTKSFSITFGSASDIPDVCDLTVLNYSGTNTLNYFKYESDQPKYANYLFIGDSKTHGYYSVSQANRATDQYSLSTNQAIVNLAAQSDALQHYVGMNNLIYKLKPKSVVMCAAFRNNISGSTFDATAKANYLSIIQNAKLFGAVIYHLKALPETSLDQSAGDAYLLDRFPNNKCITPPATWNSVTHTSDGTHPNVTGNGLEKDNWILKLPVKHYKN